MAEEKNQSEQILKLLKRIDAKLTHLINHKKLEPETWVRYSVIKELTNWDKFDLQKARKNGYLKFEERKDTGFWYLLESLNPIFFKKKQ